MQSIKGTLDQVMSLLLMINERDLFLRHHERMTMYRLLNETSLSREAEEYFIEKIRESQGLEQVTRLKKMLTDIDLSIETMKMLRKEEILQC